MPCRPLVQRREATIARDGTTGADAARPPKALRQPTPPAAPQNKRQGRAAKPPLFRRAAAPTTRVQPPHHHLSQNFESCSPRGASGLPRPTCNILRTTAPSPVLAETKQAPPAAFRGGRVPSLTSLVAHGRSLTYTRIRVFRISRHKI